MMERSRPSRARDASARPPLRRQVRLLDGMNPWWLPLKGGEEIDGREIHIVSQVLTPLSA